MISDYVFKYFEAFYGALWKNQHTEKEVWDIKKQAWNQELVGFSKEEIDVGIRKCAAFKYPPSIPEFKEFCRPLDDFCNDCGDKCAEKNCEEEAKFARPYARKWYCFQHYSQL